MSPFNSANEYVNSHMSKATYGKVSTISPADVFFDCGEVANSENARSKKKKDLWIECVSFWL